MLPRSTRPALLALGATLLAGLALVAPAAAGTNGDTWYVAPTTDTSAAQAVGGTCATPDFLTIQDAVDAAGPEDTIVVCNGTYLVDRVRIEGWTKRGLTLKAANKWKATLRSAAAPDSSIMLDIANTSRITVQHLRFQGRAAGDCTGRHTYVLNVAAVKNVDIRSNRFVAPSGASLNGCGYENAIWVEDDSTGRIRYNFIEDWERIAILSQANDLPGTLHIVGNSMRYRHAAVSGDTFSYGDGIYVHDGTAAKRVIVTHNRVTGLPMAGTSETGTTPMLGSGIYLEGANMLVAHNRVQHVDVGLHAYDYPKVKVRDNRSTDNVLDCSSDELSPRWVNNIGATSDPEGLCAPPLN